ncbi:MAG: peptide chain release factor 1 [Chloroflexi bacterium]|nr:peptide chain release factor 1 [Chloroflexota bacterium]MDA1227374.1 peptide chain release factor 1 [Chloroflexota bacterium]
MLTRLASVENRYDEIEELMADPELAVDFTRIRNLAKEQATMRTVVQLSREYRGVLKQLEETTAIVRQESDPEMVAFAKEEEGQLEVRKAELEESLRLELIPKDPNDDKNVIMEIRAGTGGDEAGLFAADLYRMYMRYAQRMGWKTEVIDASETGVGAMKEIVFAVKGQGAYSRLKYESGGHRVQRIPTTESSGRIHTSAATVAVLPEAEEVDVDIRPEDLDIDIFRAGGHGGQNVQKVETAVRITHIPTGITATCQDERSQLKNREKAMGVLRSRILAQEIERQHQEVSANRRSQIGSGDRSERIRTFNFPQGRVTDHRINFSSYNLEQILDGDIDEFVQELQQREQSEKLADTAL